jgi:hypothetical protein
MSQIIYLLEYAFKKSERVRVTSRLCASATEINEHGDIIAEHLLEITPDMTGIVVGKKVAESLAGAALPAYLVRLDNTLRFEVPIPETHLTAAPIIH